MKNSFKWLLLVALAAVAVACDPYDDLDDGPARIIGVTATDGESAAQGVPDGSGWLVQDEADDDADATDTNEVHAVCVGDTEGEVVQPVYWIHFDKQISGASVQSSLESCVPVAGAINVTVTGDLPAPEGTWYACYQPASPSANEGGSIVVFLNPSVVTVDEADTCEDERTGAPSAWGDWEYFAVASKTPTTVQITGTVKDNGGRDIPLDVRVVYNPNVGDLRNFVASATTTDSVTLDWEAADCAGGETAYEVRQLQDDGTWGAPITLAATDVTTTVTGLTGTTPTFSLWTVTTAGASTFRNLRGTVESVNLTLAAPATPTFTVSSVTLPADQADLRNRPTLTWTTVAGAEQYGVYRVSGVVGGGAAAGNVYERVGTVAQPGTGTTATFTDMSTTPGSRYSYFVQSEVDVGDETTISPRSGFADVLLFPATPAAPTIDAKEDDTVTIKWRSGGASRGRLIDYQVQRALDEATPTWVTIGVETAVTPPPDQPASFLNLTFVDDGTTAAGPLAPDTTYLYRLIARNGTGTEGGDSRPGGSASVTTEELPTPAAPTFTIAGTTVTVNWVAVTGATSYDVYRGTWCGDGFEDAALVATGETGTSFADAGRTSGDRYQYFVQAKTATGGSAVSAASAEVVIP